MFRTIFIMNRGVSKSGLFHVASLFLYVTCKKIIHRIIVFIDNLNRIRIRIFIYGF